MYEQFLLETTSIEPIAKSVFEIGKSYLEDKDNKNSVIATFFIVEETGVVTTHVCPFTGEEVEKQVKLAMGAYAIWKNAIMITFMTEGWMSIVAEKDLGSVLPSKDPGRKSVLVVNSAAKTPEGKKTVSLSAEIMGEPGHFKVGEPQVFYNEAIKESFIARMLPSGLANEHTRGNAEQLWRIITSNLEEYRTWVTASLNEKPTFH